MNVPNLVSLGRILAAPILVWLILVGRLTEAFWLFVAAGLSDAVDGFIAKRFDARTTFGKYLDPLADKVLLVCVYVSLGNAGHLPIWLVIMVVFRDALIVGGAILYHTLTHSLDMHPLVISKINTAAQIVLAAAVLAAYGLDIEAVVPLRVLEGMVAATTLASGAVYVVKWSRMAARSEDES